MLKKQGWGQKVPNDKRWNWQSFTELRSPTKLLEQHKSQGQNFVVVLNAWELSAWLTAVACAPMVLHSCLGATGLLHFISVAACLSLLQNKIRHVSWLWIFVSVKTSDVKEMIKDSWALDYQDIGNLRGKKRFVDFILYCLWLYDKKYNKL